MNDKKPVTGYKLIFGYLGIFLIIIGGIIMLPLLIIPFLPLLVNADKGLACNLAENGDNILEVVSAFRDAKWFTAFLIPGLACAALGAILFFSLLFKKEKGRLAKHQDSLLLAGIWLCAIFASMMPFLLRNHDLINGTYKKEFSFVAALFESASGYCSIGLTVFKGLVDPNGFISVPTLHPAWDGYYIYCFYRSILLFFGGVGLVLVVSSALSDRYGINLYQAEGHNDKLMPNLGRSAKLILSIYTVYIVLGIIAYVLSGMSLFDAINTSISAISTGGFTTHAESIAYYSIHNHEMVGGLYRCSAVAIEIVSIVLMLLGSTNFITHYKLVRAKFGQAFNDSEIKFVAVLIFIFIPLITLAVYLNIGITADRSFMDILRYSAFHFISCLTTTGFSNTVDAFSSSSTIIFGSTACALFILVMFIGGGAGSTSGAIKQQRAVLAIKSIHWNIRAKLAPASLKLPRQITRHGEKIGVKDSDIHEANYMILVYFLTLIAGSLSISLIMHNNGVLPYEAMFEFMSALSSTGLSLKAFDNIAANSDSTAINASMVVLTCGMYLGRLEILPAFLGGYRLGADILHKKIV